MTINKKDYILDLHNLTAEPEAVCFKIDNSFFSFFTNTEVLDANCVVDIEVKKGLSAIKIDVDIKGSIVVACDRCLADAEFPLEYNSVLLVKLSDSVEDSYWDNDSEDDILWINESVAEVDLRQYIYDSIILSLPLQRIHEEGDCDETVERYITFTEQ